MAVVLVAMAGCTSPGLLELPGGDVWALIAGDGSSYTITGGSTNTIQLARNQQELWFASLTEPLEIVGLVAGLTRPLTKCTDDGGFQLPTEEAEVEVEGVLISGPSIWRRIGDAWEQRLLTRLNRCLEPITIGQCWAAGGCATAVARSGVSCESCDVAAAVPPNQPEAPCEPHGWVHSELSNFVEGFVLCQPPGWPLQQTECGAGQHRLPTNTCSNPTACAPGFANVAPNGRDVFQVSSDVELQLALSGSTNALILLGQGIFTLPAWPSSGSYELAGTCRTQTTLRVNAVDATGPSNMRLSGLALEQYGAWTITDAELELDHVVWISEWAATAAPAIALQLNDSRLWLNNSRVAVASTANIVFAEASTVSVSSSAIEMQALLQTAIQSNGGHLAVRNSHVFANGDYDSTVGFHAEAPITVSFQGVDFLNVRAAIMVRGTPSADVEIADVHVSGLLSGKFDSRGLIAFDGVSATVERVFCEATLREDALGESDESCVKTSRGMAIAEALGCGKIARCIEAGEAGTGVVDKLWHSQVSQGSAYIDKETREAEIRVSDAFIRGIESTIVIDATGVRGGISIRSPGTIHVNRAWIIPLTYHGVNASFGTLDLTDVRIQESNSAGLNIAISGALRGERVSVDNTLRGLAHTSNGRVTLNNFSLRPGAMRQPLSSFFNISGGGKAEISTFDIFEFDPSAIKLESGLTLTEGTLHGPPPNGVFNDTDLARSARGVAFDIRPNTP